MKFISILALAACAVLVSAAPHAGSQDNGHTDIDASKKTDVEVNKNTKVKVNNENYDSSKTKFNGINQVKNQNSNTDGILNNLLGKVTVPINVLSNAPTTNIDSQTANAQNN